MILFKNILFKLTCKSEYTRFASTFLFRMKHASILPQIITTFKIFLFGVTFALIFNHATSSLFTIKHYLLLRIVNPLCCVLHYFNDWPFVPNILSAYCVNITKCPVSKKWRREKIYLQINIYEQNNYFACRLNIEYHKFNNILLINYNILWINCCWKGFITKIYIFIN